MSPRPRLASDEEIASATLRCVGRVGPHALTLQLVAAELGFSAAMLVARFGSRRGLLLAAARLSVGSSAAVFEKARVSQASPLEALLALCEKTARGMATPPQALANHLAFLQLDLQDPEFFEVAQASSKEVRAGFRELLRDAMKAGELPRSDLTRTARAVHSAYQGSLVAWAVDREGEPGRRVRQDLETLLKRPV